MLSWKKSLSFPVPAWSNLYLKHLLKIGRRYSAKAQVSSLVQSLGAQEVLMQLKQAWQEDGSRWKLLPCSGLPNDITAPPSVLTQGSQLKYLNSTNSHCHQLGTATWWSHQPKTIPRWMVYFKFHWHFFTIIVLVKLRTAFFLPSDP